MKLEEKLKQELKEAMRAKAVEKLSLLRMLVSAIRYAKIEKGGDLTEEEVVQVLRREAKKRRESVEAYRQGGRTELAEKEEQELNWIESYLPQQMSEAEVREKVKELLAGKEGLNFGQAMGLVMKELKGKADGSLVNRVVREVLAVMNAE